MSISKKLETYFITGILIIAPVVATFYILEILFNFLDGILRPFVLPIIKEKYVSGVSLILLVVLVTIAGAVGRIAIFKRIVAEIEENIIKIPLVGSIYSTIKEASSMLLEREKFLGAVLVEFPREGTYSVGFKTAPASKKLSEAVARIKAKGETGEELIHIFIPTVPNPTTGFLIAVPEKSAIKLDLSVEEAAKLILSAGSANSSRSEKNEK